MKYIARFPEDLFPANNPDRYILDLIKGEVIASQSSVLICGICRNISDVFPITKERVEEIGKLFGDYEVFIYENDSIDNTKEELSSWAKSNDKVHISLENVQTE